MKSGPNTVNFSGMYETKSGWNALLAPRAPMPPLTGSQSYDYAVIGAGYSGLAAARQLALREPTKSVALIEADVVAEGSSGRNSGFISASRVNAANGAWDAAAEFNRAATEEVCRIVEELEIDCQLTRSGGYRCSSTEKGEAELRNNLRYMEEQGSKYVILDQCALKERIGTSFYNFGVHIPDTFLLQPAALARGLAGSMPSQVKLYEHSPVRKLERGDKWHIATDEGEVKADTVILAANTNIRGLGYLGGYLMAVYTYAGLTTVLSDSDLPTMGSDSTWGISPTFKYGTTMRRLSDNRIMVRSLYSYEKEIDHESARRGLELALHKHFPQLSQVRLEHVWGGILGITLGRAPVVREVAEKLYAIGGCNGSGIAKFALLGKQLADKVVSDNQSRRTIAAFGNAKWIAPHPFRKVGFDIASAYGKRMAGKDV